MIKRQKHRISFLLLTLFLVMKLGSLHLLVHDDDLQQQEDCPICQVVLNQTAIPVFLEGEQPVVVTPFFPRVLQQEAATYTCCTFQDRLLTRHLYGRPPPPHTYV